MKLFKNNSSNIAYTHITENVRKIVRKLLSKSESEEAEKQTIGWQIKLVPTLFPLLDITNIGTLSKYYHPSKEALQDLITYLHSKDVK